MQHAAPSGQQRRPCHPQCPRHVVLVAFATKGYRAMPTRCETWAVAHLPGNAPRRHRNGRWRVRALGWRNALVLPKGNSAGFEGFGGWEPCCPPECPALPGKPPARCRAGANPCPRASLGVWGGVARWQRVPQARPGGGWDANSTANLSFPLEMLGDCGLIREGWGMCRSGAIASAGAQRKWSEPRCASTGARRDGPRGVRGLGGERPVPQNKRCLEDAVPGKPKK
jgi:hypothetical protein